MEIIYRAVDGKEFNTEIECANYEDCLSSSASWNMRGLNLDSVDVRDAELVHFTSYGSARRFIRLNDELHLETDALSSVYDDDSIADDVVTDDVWCFSPFGENDWVCIDPEWVTTLSSYIKECKSNEN